jgi:hypothetical protein
MPALTLHQGEASRQFVEHPIEVARKALLEAADLEGRHSDALGSPLTWPDLMRRFASSLPKRGPVEKAAE